MNSKIEQIIAEIEEYIDGCKVQPFSNGGKIVVSKETIDELITELRLKTPEEIKRYQKIISNKEAIMADANAKAEEIIAAAQVQNSEMVSQHEIMQEAYKKAQEVVNIAQDQADEILANAHAEAENICMSAITYTDELLKNAEDILSNSIDTAKARTENLVNSLQEYLDVVRANRSELFPKQLEYEENQLEADAKGEETMEDSEQQVQ